jgi:transketolase
MVLDCARRAGVGHIGSALSVADLIAALYGHVLLALDRDDAARDRFVLSKGHAALAVYAALVLRGVLDRGQLETYCADGTLLGVHPDHRLPGIDFSTGSLGHGLSIGAGAALAARIRRRDSRAFVLVSDAECNAGALWEAVMFAAHHQLANLIALVDLNGQQALGYTSDVLDLRPLEARWRAFGWDVHEIDGHDVGALSRALEGLDTASGPPHVLLCRTVFGKGVSFMERQIKWHYWPMSDDEYRQALRELDVAGA